MFAFVVFVFVFQ